MQYDPPSEVKLQLSYVDVKLITALEYSTYAVAIATACDYSCTNKAERVNTYAQRGATRYVTMQCGQI